MGLPPTLQVEVHGAVAVVRLARPAKRNALDDATVSGLEEFFSAPPPGVRAAVLDAQGDHFSAGLDMGELTGTDPIEGVTHSRSWHRAFARIEHGSVPVVSVLKGAVIGGGLELAAATHIRVAEPSAFYALPEGQRGLFVGGGGSVRIPRLIGVARMADLMLTGRVLDAEEGHALGLSQYRVAEGEGLAHALELAGRIATISPVTTFAVLQALPRIAQADPEQGYLMEALMAAVSSSSREAQDRMAEFLAGRCTKVGPR
jgi:enoyl-CoA hydratase/carnithine racemase